MQRRTRQRDAIKKTIEEVARPLSPTEILTSAQNEVAQLGIATVYRAINDLVDEKWLVPVDIPGQGIRYERAGLPHHHHFHCRLCDKVYEIDGCPGDLKSLAPKEFLVENHELTLVGICPACRQDRKKKPS